MVTALAVTFLAVATAGSLSGWRSALRQRDRAVADLTDFRDRLAALAAIEVYIAESGENAARNIRDLLAGTGEDDNDPRVQARAWGLEW